MAEINFGPYEPDVKTIGTTKTSNVNNVVPSVNGYAPIHAVNPFTLAMTGYCRGLFGAVQKDGNVSIFGGNDSKLYSLNATTRAWDDATRASGGDYSVGARELWDFCQYGNYVVATTDSNAVQYFELGISSKFAALAGSPPQARRCAVVGDFLVLASLSASGQSNRIQWSGINDATSWTVGTNQSDYQDFPDGGFVQGISGGEFGLVFQDRAIRRMVYTGPPNIFEFQRISDSKGVMMRYSICKQAGSTYFLSNDGFYKIDISGQLVPIGANRVNETVLAELNTESHRNMIGVADPFNPRIFWFYKSLANNLGNLTDKIVIYDWALDRWSYAGMNVANATTTLQLATTLDALDALVFNSSTVTITIASPAVVTWNTHGMSNGTAINLSTTGALPTGLTAGTTYYVVNAATNTFQLSATYGGTAINTSGSQSGTHTASQLDGLDRLPFSLDNYTNTYKQRMAVMGSDNKLGFLDGDTIEATIDTPEGAVGNGVRTFVRGVAPIGDASNVYMSVSHRDRLIDAATVTGETQIGVKGYAPTRVNARYNTVRARIPAGASWTYLRGVDVDGRAGGAR